MRSGQVARDAGVNVETRRYYARRGILQAPERRASGYREYTNEAVGVIRFVKRAQELGFSLDEIETLLTLAAGGPESCDSARTLATRKLAELDVKMRSIRAMQVSLRRLVDTCEMPRGERDCPLLGALGGRDDH
jgi:DNA-binding transcriptional MerR regulator